MNKGPESPSEDSHAPSSGFSQWRWPIVILTIATMVLVAYIYSINTAKEVAENTARNTQEAIRGIGESAITIAENFQQSKITHTCRIAHRLMFGNNSLILNWHFPTTKVYAPSTK